MRSDERLLSLQTKVNNFPSLTNIPSQCTHSRKVPSINNLLELGFRFAPDSTLLIDWKLRRNRITVKIPRLKKS
jgi:hypothetical protein